MEVKTWFEGPYVFITRDGHRKYLFPYASLPMHWCPPTFGLSHQVVWILSKTIIITFLFCFEYLLSFKLISTTCRCKTQLWVPCWRSKASRIASSTGNLAVPVSPASHPGISGTVGLAGLISRERMSVFHQANTLPVGLMELQCSEPAELRSVRKRHLVSQLTHI